MAVYEQTPQSTRKYFQRYLDTVKDTFLDSHTKSLVRHYGREAALPEFEEFGRVCAREIDTLVKTANQHANLPRLALWDGFGNYTGNVWFPEENHEAGRLFYKAGGGVMRKYRQSGSEYVGMVHYYLFCQNGEGGHSCPMACTIGLIKILRNEPTTTPLHREWLERLQDPNYDTHYHAAQFLTEIQGGSDVGGNVVKAVPVEDDPTYKGWYRLHGEKWFCSACEAHLMLIVARPEGATGEGTKGLRPFVLPRHLPYGDKKVNAFRIRRLKDKLGTRSMASGEMDFLGALALPLECSFASVMEVVINSSRLCNGIGSAAGMQRAYAEASAYSRHRVAYGQPIIHFPTIANNIAKLRAEAYAGRSVCFFLADMMDRLEGLTLPEKMVWRAGIALNKMWSAEMAVVMDHLAIDVFAGNGTIEEFTAMPRMLRDATVTQQWEGATNTLASQIFKDCQRYKIHTHLFAFLRKLAKQHPTTRLAEVEAEWMTQLTRTDGEGLRFFRDAVLELAPVMQYLLLMKEGNRHDPMVTAAAEHVLRTNTPGYRPGNDPDFIRRVNFLAAPQDVPKL
eukprot:TRINITY_DN907_c0_g2_i2.p1 TRINITY_DN907_c0_g2~~TRINITY_DN907_c0_g2_i2.p1  ORF type:complete len:578 (+),score=230.80 TRINITY_DN907_c0_g2_i2:42-1736(+)